MLGFCNEYSGGPSHKLQNLNKILSLFWIYFAKRNFNILEIIFKTISFVKLDDAK